MSALPSDLTSLDEHLLVHHYIRVFGRRPTPADLERYRRVCGSQPISGALPAPAAPAPAAPAPASVRLRLARLISRL